MQKLGLTQTQTQRLSPQQIQFIKLLQISTAELDSRIKEELEENPVLDIDAEQPSDQPDSSAENLGAESDSSDSNDSMDGEVDKMDELNLDDYLRDTDLSGYKTQADGYNQEEDDREVQISAGSSILDSLMTQLGYLPLTENQFIIGEQLIGSLEADGYLRRDLDSISNDLAFQRNIFVEEEEIKMVLHMIQQFDPAGIAARSLQECLLLQLERKLGHTPGVDLAIRIVEDCFEEFTKKHYDRIRSRLDVENYDDLRESINLITKLNPKPGESSGSDSAAQYIIPDFILNNNNGKLELSLNSRNAPELRISPKYTELFDSYEKSDKKNKEKRETVTYIKQKLDSAKWFIDAIKQRQQTLLLTMNAILSYQKEFFLSGDESRLKPMILKDIADQIGMDISTVSRVANSKFVQTEFGTYALKYFFSEGISTDSGEDVSNREVKFILKELIDHEDKSEPLSDDKLEKILNDRGYNIARRTVAKYREQLNIPVARLRRRI